MSENKVEELDKKWYVVNTYAGHENRVKDNLEKRMETMGIQDCLFNIIVAEEDEIEIKNGKKVQRKKNLFPGYLFVEMIMTDDAWYVVRNTPGVTGFIGSSGGGAKPFSVPQEEIDAILRRLGKTDVSFSVDFAIGDRVKILMGPLSGNEGVVTVMDDANQMATITINFLNRETSTEIPYLDLERVEE